MCSRLFDNNNPAAAIAAADDDAAACATDVTWWMCLALSNSFRPQTRRGKSG